MKIAPGSRALLLAMLFVLMRSAVSAQTLPSPWMNRDIGNQQIGGDATYSSGTFAITAGGGDIWEISDQFHFVYRPVTGDVEILARVASIELAHRWSKAGVMIRESLTAESRQAMMIASAGAGYAFLRRSETGSASDNTAGPASAPPGWVRLVRQGDLFSADYSSDGTTWVLVGSDTIPMESTVYVGLAVTSHNNSASATAALDSVRVIAASLANSPPAISITDPVANSQFVTPASIAIAAIATDPENAMLSVDFYANQTLISRDTTEPYSASFATSTPGSYSLTTVAHDADGNSTTSGAVPITVQSPSNQVPTVSLTSPTSGEQFNAPATISLIASASDPENQMARVEFYSGATLLGTDTSAPYSFSWTTVAAGTYSLTARAYDTGDGIGTSTAVSVTIGTSTSGLPSGQTSQDIGAPSVTGSATYSTNVYTIIGAGADIWDTADQFQFVYAQATGDVEVRAHVTSITNTNGWAKAGVMVRESLTAGSRHAFALVTAGEGSAFQHRPETAGLSEHTAGSIGQASGWVRLVRTGNIFQAYESTDGVTWRLVGSQTIQMTAEVYVGIAVTSHNTATATTAEVDNLTITVPSGNTPPFVTLTSPMSGATFSAPATIDLTATASDPENQLARVEFLSDNTVLGDDTSAPFAWTWSSVAAGTYTLTARAYDSAGVSATSSAVTVTVETITTAPRLVVFTASADHATNVTSYSFEVFAAGANPATAVAIASSDLGKPAPASNGDITVDRATLFSALAVGDYVATVTAVGPGGRTRSAPISFTR